MRSKHLLPCEGCHKPTKSGFTVLVEGDIDWWIPFCNTCQEKSDDMALAKYEGRA